MNAIDSAQAPLWARLAAYAVPLTVLPSSAWRISLLFGLYGENHVITQAVRAEPVYIVSLSVVSLSLALLTIGLVHRWGEFFPRWFPLVGRRRVPVKLAVVPASIGAALLIVAVIYGILNSIFQFVPPLNPTHQSMPLVGRDLAVVKACYLPLVVTGPLLLAVTINYYRRRTRALRADK